MNSTCFILHYFWELHKTKNKTKQNRKTLVRPKMYSSNLLIIHRLQTAEVTTLRTRKCHELVCLPSFPLKQTDRMCWTIQTHSDKLNWARRHTFHELNSLSFFRLMKSSTFGLGLTDSKKKSYKKCPLLVFFRAFLNVFFKCLSYQLDNILCFLHGKSFLERPFSHWH